MKTFTDLPSPETIKKYTVRIAPAAGHFNKAVHNYLAKGLTARGTPRKLEYRRRKV